jgi:hypothetical protein
MYFDAAEAKIAELEARILESDAHRRVAGITFQNVDLI